jgi:hypothetical protein
VFTSRTRVALYDPRAHVLVRVIWLGMLAFCGVAVIVQVRDALRSNSGEASWWISAYALAWLLVYRTCLITCRIYGTAAGVEVVQWDGKVQLIPWTKVGKPGYVAWSINPAFPRVAIFSPSCGRGPIHFYANRRVLARFRAWREHRGHAVTLGTLASN